MMNYANMSHEELVALLQQRDAEEFGGKSLLFKQRKTVLKMTRKQLSEATGISENTLTNYECMKNAPDYSRLRQVRDAYQLTEEQFMTYLNEICDKAESRKQSDDEEVVEVVEEIKPRRTKKVS